MSTLDLDAIRLRAATWFRPGTQHPVERDVLDLLAEVERLRADLATEQMVSASMRAAIDAEDAEP